VDGASLAEESAEATPERGRAMAERLSMSPSGLIDALQGLGLVRDAPVLKAKITGVKLEGEVLRAKTLPRESMNAYDRVSNWVSTLKPFSPLKPTAEEIEIDGDTHASTAVSVMGSPSMCATEAASDSESVADTESVGSLGDALERLDIGDELSPLTALLRACGQTQNDIKTMATLCKKYFSNKAKKIGEGTYGEAFKGDGVVTKIIPMGGDALVNGEVQMGPSEVHAETAIVTRLTELSADDTRKNFTDGFIRLVDASVCRGPYSKKLLTAWDKYAAKGESENEKPDNLPSNQLYIAFTCEDGGVDLEHFEFRSATEAVALLFQIVVALAVAEEESQFEHRDLHWGNVLIKRTRTQKKQARLNGVDINIQTSGLNVTIIDFTLSRLTADSGETFFLDLDADPELFNGPKKHCQSETYRRMKKATKGKWDSYEPKTNALWLHYLADTVLEQKHYSVTMEQKKALSEFRKRALTYKSAHAAMFDELFSGIWTSGTSVIR
jgi:serine/threonine-protein kinase haspin